MCTSSHNFNTLIWVLWVLRIEQTLVIGGKNVCTFHCCFTILTTQVYFKCLTSESDINSPETKLKNLTWKSIKLIKKIKVFEKRSECLDFYNKVEKMNGCILIALNMCWCLNLKIITKIFLSKRRVSHTFLFARF